MDTVLTKLKRLKDLKKASKKKASKHQLSSSKAPANNYETNQSVLSNQKASLLTHEEASRLLGQQKPPMTSLSKKLGVSQDEDESIAELQV